VKGLADVVRQAALDEIERQRPLLDAARDDDSYSVMVVVRLQPRGLLRGRPTLSIQTCDR
jgi:phage gp36-like protein